MEVCKREVGREMLAFLVDDFLQCFFGLFDVSFHHLFEGLAIAFPENLLPFHLFGGAPEKIGPFRVEKQGEEEDEKGSDDESSEGNQGGGEGQDSDKKDSRTR
jgi:hypothetical protein